MFMQCGFLCIEGLDAECRRQSLSNFAMLDGISLPVDAVLSLAQVQPVRPSEVFHMFCMRIINVYHIKLVFRLLKRLSGHEAYLRRPWAK